MRSFRSLLLPLALILACTPAPSAPPATGGGTAPTAAPVVKRSENQVLRAAVPSLPLAATPEVSSTSVEIFWSQFDNLLQFDEKFNLLPSAAERWQPIPGKDGWRFFLRKDLTFSNGDKVTAADLEFSIKNSLEVRTPLAGQLSKVAGAEVVDDYTVDILTRGPDISLLFTAPRVWILPKAYYQQIGKDGFALKPIGSGPFELVDYKANDSMSYRRRANYTHPIRKPNFTEIRWRAIPESSQLLNGLRLGEIDLAYSGLAAAQLVQARTDGMTLVTAPAGGSNYTLTMDRPALEKINSPLLDKRVRIALNYAIDRDSIARTVYSGLARPAHQLAIYDIPLYDPTIPPIPFDVARAKALLAEAGYPTGLKFQTKLDFLATGSTPDLMLALQSFWKAVGVEIELSPLENATWADTALKRNGRAPGELIQITIGDSSGVFVSGNNYTCSGETRWCVPEFDRNLTVAHAEPDQAKRTAALQAANKAYSAEFYQIQTIYLPNYVVVSPKVKDLKVTTYWVTNFDTAYKID